VLRPSSLPPALAVVAARLTALVLMTLGTVVAATGAPAAASDAPVDPSQPLVLHMRSITPDYVPDKGPIVIRGTVRNASDEKWTAINVHGFIGPAPMTTAAELAAAAQTPLTADVGHRITVPGTFFHIDALQPGETSRFVVRLPRSTLSVSLPGVYWFGVHVLGDNGQGGSRVAVGRDRTFLPLVPKSATDAGQQVDTALVIPVRAGITRGSDGAVEDPEHWVHSLRSVALHDVVALGQAARGLPLTWVVDPAVPDAVRALARGNPPRTLGNPGPSTGGGSPSSSPNPSASGSASPSGASASAAGGDPAAHRWLRLLRGLLAVDSGEVLGLPYGDVAVDTAHRYDQSLLDQAFRHTGRTLKPWGLPMSSVVAPPDGRMAGDTVAAMPRATDVLIGDSGVKGTAPTVSEVNGRRVILASTGASTGGPGPVDPLSPLALRQRILSEAALRLLNGRQPLVVELPIPLHHRVGAGFFTGLEVPWLRLTTLGGATAVQPRPVSASRLRVPSEQKPQLGSRLYAAVDDVLDSGRTLQSVLVGNRVLHRQLFEETATNTSYAAARDPFGAYARVSSTARWVRDNLDRISVAAPPSVTLASASGRFSALVSNDLDVPVMVEVRALADPRLDITGGEKVPLAPHGRTTVLLNASTQVLGVHTVTLELTNAAGRPLGAADQFPLRAEQVSRLIWVIIGAGVALLFAAIFVRLVRRILRSRAG
jgi:Family of unknown function (DUF6049)